MHSIPYMPIEVSTTQFQFSHGKSPRGYGHWLFKLGRRAELFAVTAKYSDALRAAKSEAKRLAEIRVEVMP